MSEASRPTTVLIAAMGGEGGAVLMNWIVTAATAEGLLVQSTSVPGVAQRTGATTYYIEMLAVAPEQLNGRRPVLSLYPGIGDIDLVVASELIEVARAMERGFVSPERTTLVGCTHRFYSVAEKMHGTDGRFDSERALAAAPQLAKQAILFDGQEVARESESVINAVLLGVIAGTALLPLSAAAFEDAIRTTGKAVDMNLRGFAAGLEYGRGDYVEAPASPEVARLAPGPGAAEANEDLAERARRELPERSHAIVLEGVSRLIDYQDRAYADLYLDRLRSVSALDADASGAAELTGETGRYLALWMSYEDVIRVAQLKTRAGRLRGIRDEAGAEPGQIVRVTEYLKPGIEELCSILPPRLARRILGWAGRKRRLERLHFGVQVESTTISGFLRLWLMARLRRLRRTGYRYQQEQAMIERWLEMVRGAAKLDMRLAAEVAQCAKLVRGYGDTHLRGVEHFERIAAEIVAPVLEGRLPLGSGREMLRESREAALAAPESEAAGTAAAPPVLTSGPGLG